MSTEVTIALIGAGAVIIAAVIGAYASLRQHSNSAQNVRRSVRAKQVDLKKLRSLAISQTDEYVRDRKQFSAWEVTLVLRATYPEEQIDHDEVRNIVHAHMQTIINDGRYKRTTRQKSGTSFSRYVPVR
jgi:di/tripeptidase